MQNAKVRWFILCFIAVSTAAICQLSRAATTSPGPVILSGPTFIPATNAPLAGTLQLTTSVNSRVSVLVSDGTNTWERDFFDFTTNHSEILLGFKPARTNLIQVTVYDENRNATTSPQLLTFVTAPLPAGFPTSVVLQSVPSMMEPGYTLCFVLNRNAVNGYIVIMDNSGEVVWYWLSPVVFSDVDVRQLDNGDLFIPQQPPANNFLEINMLGQTVSTLSPATGYPIDEHDGVPTDHGTILYISDITRSVSNFPSSFTVSNAPLTTANVEDTPVVEMSATNSALLGTWSPINLLNPTRITYLTANSPKGIDNEHGNAVLDVTNDNCIIESLRNQNAVFKFTRAGQLKWILGEPANWGTNLQKYLLTPEGTPFEWNYGQHGPMITPQGTLLVYDDGNFRANPWDPPIADQTNYSRGVEFNIDETNMQVSQVWDTTQADEDRLYTAALGKTQWLPQRRNVLVTYGFVSYVNGVHPSAYAPNATMARIIEYTHDPVPQVVFDLSFFDYTNTSSGYLGYFVYRAERIPDLYTHPANPVADIAVNEQNRMPVLEFSADPVLTYAVQASTDLANWTTIGPAVQEDSVGDYGFEDLEAGQYTARFYRVVTQPGN